MGRTHGVRRGTRYMFSVDYKKHGPTPLQKWFVNYKVGDIVDIKVSMASVLRVWCGC
jgi:large subunit ribosomal protein L21e